MIKILVWKCDKCEAEYEVYYNSEELKALMDEDTPQLCLCGGGLYPFNLKNNCHRWRFADE